jgi:PncC family amidohydrolase
LRISRIFGYERARVCGTLIPKNTAFLAAHIRYPNFLETFLEPVEITIANFLRQWGLKLALAESCTGGLVADRITDLPGSSEYFLGGLVTYSYEAKVSLLGVSWDTLRQHGAVSRETVIEMARGARTVLGADIAVSVSGIAGPGGGMPGKPVGYTWFGLSALEGDYARNFTWDGDRRANKQASADAALQFLLDYLQKSA